MTAKMIIGCPGCNQRMKVATTAEGRSARCPSCQTSFTIRAPRPAPTQPAEPVYDAVPVGTPVAAEVADSSPPLAPLAPLQDSAWSTATAAPQSPAASRPSASWKQKQASDWPNSDDWKALGGAAFCLLIFFVALAAPGLDIEPNGGRGKARLAAKLLYYLGDYAPLLGILFGLGSVFFATSFFRTLPEKIRYPLAGVGSLGVTVVGLVAFLLASGVLSSGSSNDGVLPTSNLSTLPIQSQQPPPWNPQGAALSPQEILERQRSQLPQDIQQKIKDAETRAAEARKRFDEQLEKRRQQTRPGGFIETNPIDPFATPGSTPKPAADKSDSVDKLPPPVVNKPGVQPENAGAKRSTNGFNQEVKDPFAKGGGSD